MTKQRTSGTPRQDTPLSRMVNTTLTSFSATNVEHDRGASVLEKYIPGSGTLDVIARLNSGMRGGKRGRNISVTGPYGSGKSTMAVFLDALTSPRNSLEWDSAYKILKRTDHVLAASYQRTRQKLNVHKSGFVRCMVTAKREPISVTLVRALYEGVRRRFGNRPHPFDRADKLRRMANGLKTGTAPDPKCVLEVVRGLANVSPTIIIIDEFGKNIEYFTDENDVEGDLFLLQEIAEMSASSMGASIFVVTLQHMAFEEYATDASTSQKQEWAKVQGRFDDIPFANSHEQTRLLVANVITRANNPQGRKAIESWAKAQTKKATAAGLGGDIDYKLLYACYPLHPLSLEVLPELCARYGQNERTLLSFLAGGGSHTVSRFIDEHGWDGKKDTLPTVRLDTLYDFFVSGSPLVHSSSSSFSRLMEIETIIRDSHGLSEDEMHTLKTIGILNLIGRTGRIRASKSMIKYATRIMSEKTLKSLTDRSIVTYRRYADEYRIWHGTDMDIQTGLEISRRKLTGASLAEMLTDAMTLYPIVAAKHSISTGTTRVFERRFADSEEGITAEPGPGYDGAVTYVTDNVKRSMKRVSKKPTIVVYSDDLEGIREAATEYAAIQDLLTSNPEVATDWVARRELLERRAWAESSIDAAFEQSFGRNAIWEHIGGKERSHSNKTTASAFVSRICDDEYCQAPHIHNEMINRNTLSTQGATARKTLMEAMLTNARKPGLDISGWGPERAMYEAVLANTGIHRRYANMLNNTLGLYPPTNDTIKPIWKKIKSIIQKLPSKRISIDKIYDEVYLPPFGVKEGLLPILLIAVILSDKENIALYERGTYTPKITAEIGERLFKNPAHFEIKYFANNRVNRSVIESVSSELGIQPKNKFNQVTLLDVVSHLVFIVRSLEPYILKTKRLESDVLAVRNAILNATEPDTLLLESLPESLGLKSFTTQRPSAKTIAKYTKRLATATNILVKAFDNMLVELRALLFETTGIPDRTKLSRTAMQMQASVTDSQMKIFLTALTHDVLERDDDWIKYVALTLTGIPPADWTDEQYVMFSNSLRETYTRFVRLASIHFLNVADSYAKPPYRVTITHADGKEYINVVSISAERERQAEAVAKKAIHDMTKKGFAKYELRSLLAAIVKQISQSETADSSR